MKPTLDLQAELDRLNGLTLFELRNEWRRLHRMAPPMRLSRDLTLRGIAYRLQELAHGGLSRLTLNVLGRSAPQPGGLGKDRMTGITNMTGMAGNTVPDLDPSSHSKASGRARTVFVMPKPGTRLIREWRGVTHAVLVHADGYEWQGRRHRSLSVIARAITGAHWSGPRFFGLRSARVHKTAPGGVAAPFLQSGVPSGEGGGADERN